MHLTIGDAIYTDTTVIACHEFEWYGETYTESGDYEQNFTTEQGCDSIVTLHLTIGDAVYSDTTVIACHEFEWYGETYTESGDYEQTFITELASDHR